MHFGSDGKLHSYSSKPPLLVWLYSGVYAVVHVITQTDVYRSPLEVGRWTIAASHLLPLGIYYWLMLSTLNRFAKTDFGFVILAVGSVMATPLLPFSVSINNHLPGAIVALLTLLATWRALHGRYAWQWSVVAGLAAGLGVACELPALAWAGAAGLLLLVHSPVRAVVGYGGALALVGTLSLIANWTTHGSWKPPYAHRSLGPLMATLTDDKTPQAAERLTLPPLAPALSTDPPPAGPSQAALVTWLQAQGIDPATATIVPSLRSQHWEVRIVDSTTKAIIGRYALVPNATGIVWQIHQWDDWYDYPGTYWARGKATGVDRGEPSRLRYAFHALFGHHGIFSLTPIWLLAVIGCWRWFDRETMPAATGIRDPLATDLTPGQLRATVGLIVAVTVVCFAFYISRPLEDRNYGGVSCCFRWLVWCIPLWTVLAIPGADWCARSRWRIT